MTYFRGGRRFRECRFTGYAPGIYIPLYLPRGRGFKIVFYDPQDHKVGELGSDVMNHLIESVSFQLLESGCGSVDINLTGKPPFEIGYRTRVDIYPYFSTDPWYTGFIYDLPKKTSKTTILTYQGFGYYDQLDWVHVTGVWTNKRVSEIIADIVENSVAPKTAIRYNKVKILDSPSIITNYNADTVKAKEAIQKLAGFEENFVWGVDNFREFFFWLRSDQVMGKLWVGKHCEDLEIEENASQLANRLYVKAGVIQNGTNYIGVVEDLDSINKYGIREAVVTAPEAINVDDALAWAEAQLNTKCLKKITGKAKNAFLTNMKPIEPKGKLIITDTEGREYRLRLIGVDYTISTSGISANLNLEDYE